MNGPIVVVEWEMTGEEFARMNAGLGSFAVSSFVSCYPLRET
jgi:hypothetical protein